MAVLETIRVKFGIVITVLIAIALLSFIIDPSTLSAFNSDQAAGQDTEVASINGHSVNYTEFNDILSLYNETYPYEMYEATVLSKNPDMNVSDIKKQYNEEMRARAMNDLLMEHLYVVKAKNAGFNVSEEEMYQLLSGQMFSNTIFAEFQGQMTPDLLIDVESKTSEDTPEARMYKAWWDRIKKTTEQERYVTKYANAFTKSMFSNPLLAEDEIQNSNNVFDLEFVMVPFEAVGDTSIVVSEKEIKDYYAAHKNLFPCEETRELHYVVVEVNEENEDAEYHKLDSVINSVNGIENFRKAAMNNGYLVDSTPVSMRTANLGAVSGVESLIKWSFKETSVGGVSDIYTIENGENMYHVVAALGKINPKGYSSVEDFQVRMFIERTLYQDKVADKKLAEVKTKVDGLNDLKAIATALGMEVSKKEKVTFASADLDPKFVGAASVAAEGVVSAPFKGSNGIYVYKVVNRSVESYYTEDDAKATESQLAMMYGQMLPLIINEEGKVKDNSYLYF